MRKLVEGIVRFRETTRPEYREAFSHLALEQKPDAIFFACSDSRVVPNLFASTDPGDLLVSRSIGNLVPPSDAEGVASTDQSEAAAIEFALLQLNVRDAIVCGHSGCGAMKALYDGFEDPRMPNLAAWLRHGAPALDRFRAGSGLDTRFSPVDQLSQLNVLVQMEHIRSYPMVRDAEASGHFGIHGLWFDLRTADVYAYELDEKRFVLLDEAEGERLLKRTGR